MPLVSPSKELCFSMGAWAFTAAQPSSTCSKMLRAWTQCVACVSHFETSLAGRNRYSVFPLSHSSLVDVSEASRMLAWDVVRYFAYQRGCSKVYTHIDTNIERTDLMAGSSLSPPFHVSRFAFAPISFAHGRLCRFCLIQKTTLKAVINKATKQPYFPSLVASRIPGRCSGCISTRFTSD